MSFIISFREFFKYKGQLLLFLLSLIFSLSVFISLDSVQVGIDDYINQRKQILVGGDIKISSRRPFDSDLQNIVSNLKLNYEYTDIYEFSSMVNTDESSLLSQIKIVSDKYPLYGEMNLASKKDIKDQLTKGNVIVESILLDSLGLKIGDYINLGNAKLKIVDILLSEPDRTLDIFSFGPRVLVSYDDLKDLGLLGEKSRISYTTLFRIEDIKSQNDILENIKNKIQKPTEVESIQNAETVISRFSDRFLLFLKLVIFSLLILTGIAITSIMKAFLQSQRNLIAIRKSLGEKLNQIINSYLKVFFLWTVVGIIGSIILSNGMMIMIKNVLSPILPKDILLNLSLLSITKAIVLGISTTLLVARFTLEKSTLVSPADLFHINDTKTKTFDKSLIWIFFVIFIYGFFIIFEIDNLLWGSLFLVGIICLFILFWSIAFFIIKLISRFDNRFSYSFRLVVRSVQRKGSNTNIFLSIFTLSLTLLFSLILIENSIQKVFNISYSANTPNIFLLDIKADQINALKNIFPNNLDFYPIVRAPIISVNNKPIEKIKEESNRFGDNITRSFNLTYYDKLLDTEKLIKGKSLFVNMENDISPVSIMDNIADDLKVSIGDVLVFNIQGVEIKSKITSIRKRNDFITTTPFFYFVFPPEILSKAPQTIFATSTVNEQSINKLQADIVKNFPQISILDTSKIGDQVIETLNKLSDITYFFTLFNLCVGFVVFIASLMSTSEKRKEESVFYRLQGMTLSNVWKIIFYELTFISFFTIAPSLLFSLGLTKFILYILFDLDFSSLPIQIYLYVIVMIFTIFSFGFLVMYKPLKTKPIFFIRENTR